MKIWTLHLSKKAWSNWTSGATWSYAFRVSGLFVVDMLLLVLQLISIAVLWFLGTILWKGIIVNFFAGLVKETALALRKGFTDATGLLLKWAVVLAVIYFAVNHSEIVIGALKNFFSYLKNITVSSNG